MSACSQGDYVDTGAAPMVGGRASATCSRPSEGYLLGFELSGGHRHVLLRRRLPSTGKGGRRSVSEQTWAVLRLGPVLGVTNTTPARPHLQAWASARKVKFDPELGALDAEVVGWRVVSPNVFPSLPPPGRGIRYPLPDFGDSSLWRSPSRPSGGLSYCVRPRFTVHPTPRRRFRLRHRGGWCGSIFQPSFEIDGCVTAFAAMRLQQLVALDDPLRSLKPRPVARAPGTKRS